MPLLQIAQQSFGAVQRSGALAVLPLYGPDTNGKFAGPLSGLKLAGVKGYGNVELENPRGSSGISIVPLHIGYIQDRAQNHAMCRSAFLAPGQKLLFQDACCVQQSQGGYLQGAEQWFFILPLALREEALSLRRVQSYGKLWPAIARLNVDLGLPERGHLEQIVCRQRPYLTQYASRFELLKGQTGALFFLGQRLVGMEIAPSPRYFAEVWMPLVCFCYGVAAMQLERNSPAAHSAPAEPFAARNLEDLRHELAESRRRAQDALMESLRAMPRETFALDEEERFLDLSLKTLTGKSFVGQTVDDGGRLVYASIFARKDFLTSPMAAV